MMAATVIPSASPDLPYGVSEAIARGTCACCRAALGRIINRGAVCQFCEQRVCKSCREYKTYSVTEWICTACHKEFFCRNVNSKGWLSELVERTSNKLHYSIKHTLKRSLTFSESSPSPWSALRGSPELRAYSSMPRHQDGDYVPSGRQPLSTNKDIRTEEGTKNEDSGSVQNEFKVVDTCGAVVNIPSVHISSHSDLEDRPGDSPTLMKRSCRSNDACASSSSSSSCSSSQTQPVVASAVNHLRKKMVDLTHLPPCVTPPRRRRLFMSGRRLDDQMLPELGVPGSPFYDYGPGRVFMPDRDDYRLVFISSSDSSSHEEIHSDDASSTCSGAMTSLIDDCDWDYFENSSKSVPILSNFDDYHHHNARRSTQKSILVPIERESDSDGKQPELLLQQQLLDRNASSKSGEEGSSGKSNSCRVVGAEQSSETSSAATTSTSHSSYLEAIGSAASSLCVPLPIPVPIPVPIFVPVPCNNPELTIRVEHYFSPGFWSNFTNSNYLNNFYSLNHLHSGGESASANGNNDIFYNFNIDEESTASSNLRPSRSMESSQVIETSDETITSASVVRDEVIAEEKDNDESEPSMLLKTHKSFLLQDDDDDNDSCDATSGESVVKLKTYRTYDETRSNLKTDATVSSLHPDDGQFSSLSDSSESSSSSRSPVRRKYKFNNNASDQSDVLEMSTSSDEDSSDQETDNVVRGSPSVCDRTNVKRDPSLKGKRDISFQKNNKSDISLSTIFNFDKSLHKDSDGHLEVGEIEREKMDKGEKSADESWSDLNGGKDAIPKSFPRKEIVCDNSIVSDDELVVKKKIPNLMHELASNRLETQEEAMLTNKENSSEQLDTSRCAASGNPDATDRDARSSDEFSGTESMELVPIDQEQGHIRSSSVISESCARDKDLNCTSSGPFTSLIMITEDRGGMASLATENESPSTSERGSPVHVNVITNDTTTFVSSKDKEKFKLTLNTSHSSEDLNAESETSQNTETSQSQDDEERDVELAKEQVRVVTGANTLSAVVCLEEGLADDDSWVEELDREEMPVTDSSEGEENFNDREEELRGYHRTAIDYSLFTIVEESCEESEIENEKSLPTQLENYFLNRIGGGDTISLKIEDTVSETSSIFSEDVESADNLDPEDLNKTFSFELGTSRLEQYFLTEFMGFSRRDSDGSVGSDSEGRRSPEQRRKRLVRARGTGRHYSSSLDNLTESEQQVEMQLESENSSSETDSRDESCSFDKNDGQFDTVKRTKKKKRSVTSAPSLEMLDVPEEHVLNNGNLEEVISENENDDQIELMNQSDRNKHQSRDSGFMGSSDDLIKETKIVVDPDTTLTKVNEDEISTPEIKEELDEVTSTVNPTLSPVMSVPPQTALSRKDSFNNWSSDEETNLMMSKMKAFFKTMVANQPKVSSPAVKQKPPQKPPQLIYFESELTRLMKTVPGIREDQVREIVEYLSSEDTWSDSCDSSDYTSSDLDIGYKKEMGHTGLNLDEAHDSTLVYQRLLASFSKVDTVSSDSSASQNSPPLIAKVMQHIGSRLVALMHEVSSGEGAPSPRISRYHRRIQPKLSNISTTTEEEEDPMEEFSPLPRSKSHDPLLEEARQEASDNERYSWRGSFESALMVSDSRGRLASGSEMSNSASALAIANAKRRSAGDLLFKSQSREQLDRVRSCGSIGGSVEDKIWGLRQHPKRRRSSVPDSAANSGGSADGEDDSDDDEEVDIVAKSTTLPRSLQSSCSAGTNSLPRLPTSTAASPSIYKAHSAHHVNVKSARYRPPGYNTRGTVVSVPPRRDNRRRSQLTPPPIAAHLASSPLVNSDEASFCSDSLNRSLNVHSAEEEVAERLNHHNKSSLGARSDSMASVYSGAGEGRYGSVTVKGEVEFGLQYNYKAGALEIHVKQCKDLAPVDTKRVRSDPYVKVYLLPDKSKAGKRKTRVKKHTLNPVFDEVLKFHLTLEDLESRTLWLSVWHSDMFGRNDFLGEIMMPLEHKVFDDPSPKSYTLQERSEILDELISSKGELIIGLKFVPPEEATKKSKLKGNLHVLIKEAKNLCPVKSNSTIDGFCKAYLLPDKGRSSKHKTNIVKRSTSPFWNHTIVYRDVTLEELAERSLELTIWDHDRLTSNEFLGGIRLNLGHGKHYGKITDWMDSSGKEILLWQQMMERPNFWVESCIPLRSSLDLRNN